MQYPEAKQKFLQAWGNLGSSWGLNRTMAKVFALLLISPRPLSAEDIMNELQISSGNANMNIRALMDWGIVFKVDVPGERKEFFIAEKDLWAMSRQVAAERRKRELDPLVKTVEEVKKIKNASTEEEKEFMRATKELSKMLQSVDKGLKILVNSETNWFLDLIRLWPKSRSKT